MNKECISRPNIGSASIRLDSIGFLTVDHCIGYDGNELWYAWGARTSAD